MILDKQTFPNLILHDYIFPGYPWIVCYYTQFSQPYIAGSAYLRA